MSLPENSEKDNSVSTPSTFGRLKSWLGSQEGKQVALVAVILLTSSLSFGLGRLSATENGGGVRLIMPNGQSQGASAIDALNGQNGAINTSSTHLKPHEFINQPLSESVGDSDPSAVPNGAMFVASSRGKKYYPIWCSAAKSLSPANKIYFNTEDEATAKGYTKSSSCK